MYCNIKFKQLTSLSNLLKKINNNNEGNVFIKSVYEKYSEECKEFVFIFIRSVETFFQIKRIYFSNIK